MFLSALLLLKEFLCVKTQGGTGSFSVSAEEFWLMVLITMQLKRMTLFAFLPQSSFESLLLPAVDDVV